MPKFSAVSLADQARQRLRDRAAPAGAFPAASALDAAPADVQQLVQELQVQQLELEIQNEELLLAQVEAETARAQYAQLYDFAPAALFTLAADGSIAQLNAHASRLLGTPAALLNGRHFPLFVALNSRDAFRAFLQACLSARTGAPWRCTCKRRPARTLSRGWKEWAVVPLPSWRWRT